MGLDKRDLTLGRDGLLASDEIESMLVTMTDFQVPAEISSLAEKCVHDVHEELGFDLDYTTLTLPVLDHYCRSARRRARWSDHAEELAQSVGSYFGEVIRRHFGGGCRWVTSATGLHAWRLEFERCFLCFNPLGSALELLLEDAALGWNAEFVTHAEAESDLQKLLGRLPGVSEQDFYTLSVRSEVLETICSFLEQWERTRESPGHRYDTAAYEDRLAQLAANATMTFE